jgi:hypothetical protein
MSESIFEDYLAEEADLAIKAGEGEMIAGAEDHPRWRKGAHQLTAKIKLYNYRK